MISEEVKSVVRGEYCNPKLDIAMGDILLDSILRLDMTRYMNLVNLRSNIITSKEYIEEVTEEAGLGV